MARTIMQIARKHDIDIKEIHRWLGKQRWHNGRKLDDHTKIDETTERHLVRALGSPELAPSSGPGPESGTAIEFAIIDDLPPDKPGPFREGVYPVHVHDEVLGQARRHRGNHVDKRLHLVLRQLMAHGRTPIVKGTKGDGKGWLRTPLGGAAGMQFYLWWAASGSPAVRALESSGAGPAPNLRLVRAIRHHDDHRPLDPGHLDDYYRVGVPEVMAPDDFPDPWTSRQKEFWADPHPVRMVEGAPGSGKTTALLRTVERVLYVTWSERLATLAAEHLATFGPEDGEQLVLTFAELVERLLPGSSSGTPSSAHEYARFARRFELLPDRKKALWREHAGIFYGEIRAHLVGRALPDTPAELLDPAVPLLREEAYLGLRQRQLRGRTARGVVSAAEAIKLAELVRDGELFSDLLRAFRAGRRLAEGDPIAPELAAFDRLVVDEIQDLTAVEILVLLRLVRRVAESRGRLPRVVMAGDEGQTVRPTGFAWGWLKDLVRDRLGVDAHSIPFEENLRCPPRIAGVVEDLAELYGTLSRAHRPGGQRLTRPGSATTDRLYHARMTSPDAKKLLEQLETLEHVAILSFDPVRDARQFELDRAVLLSPEEVKGLDFQTVCLLNMDLEMLRIEVDSTAGWRRDEEALTQSRRTGVDRLRVAASRSAETLIFLDTDDDDDDEFLPYVTDLLAPWQPIRIEHPEALVEDLRCEDVEERVRECIRQALELVDRNSDLAWMRAQQALGLIGQDREVPGSLGDEALRFEARMTCVRTALSIWLMECGRPVEPDGEDRQLTGFPESSVQITQLSESVRSVKFMLFDGAKAAQDAKEFALARWVGLLAHEPQTSLGRQDWIGEAARAVAEIRSSETWLDRIIARVRARWRDETLESIEQVRPEDLEIVECLPERLSHLGVVGAGEKAREAQLRWLTRVLEGPGEGPGKRPGRPSGKRASKRSATYSDTKNAQQLLSFVESLSEVPPALVGRARESARDLEGAFDAYREAARQAEEGKEKSREKGSEQGEKGREDARARGRDGRDRRAEGKRRAEGRGDGDGTADGQEGGGRSDDARSHWVDALRVARRAGALPLALEAAAKLGPHPEAEAVRWLDGLIRHLDRAPPGGLTRAERHKLDPRIRSLLERKPAR